MAPSQTDQIGPLIPRYSLSTAEQTENVQFERTMLEIRQYRKDVQRLAAEASASQEQFEVLLTEIMKHGLPAEQEPVEVLLA